MLGRRTDEMTSRISGLEDLGPYFILTGFPPETFKTRDGLKNNNNTYTQSSYLYTNQILNCFRIVKN